MYFFLCRGNQAFKWEAGGGIIKSLFITRVIFNVSHKQLVSPFCLRFYLWVSGSTFTVKKLSFQLFSYYKLTGEKREALVKRTVFGPKNQPPNALALNTGFNFNNRENSSATVYIHADFATSPVLFLDSMKMLQDSLASQFQSCPILK